MMKKLMLLTFFLVLIISGCSDKKNNPQSVIEVVVSNHHSLDSLIIYDKDKSWEIKSSLRFNEGPKAVNTPNIEVNKIYQIYSFSKGTQVDLGELIVSPNSKIMITFDETDPFESIKFDGSFQLSNNFLAFLKRSKNQMSNMVRKGIDQEKLDSLIQDKRGLILNKGISSEVDDSLQTYVVNNYDHFANILKQKNDKYLYKASLSDTIGNHFSFRDINSNIVPLSKFMGKFIYIDVWATWCKPCKVEYVFLKELEEHFVDHDDLEIISISTDGDFDKWKAYVEAESLKGVQLYSGSQSDFVEFYDIGALPRFIFLDKEGRVISADEIRPSNPEALKKLESIVFKTEKLKTGI